MQETWAWSLSWEDPLEKKWQPTPVFLPGESHWQRSLEGYRPWVCEESDMTEKHNKNASILTLLQCSIGEKWLTDLASTQRRGWRKDANPRRYSLQGSESCSVKSDSLQPHGLSMDFSRPDYWSGSPFPSPGDLPNPGIEPRSPTLQADCLPAELQGKPKNTGVGSLSPLQGIFPTQESNWGLLHCGRIRGRGG